MIRVISGKAKGRKLKMVPGETTRPIMDRVKENLFNILGNRLKGMRWLDLFAGTGQVGIEALSRGASEVVFIDTALPAIRTLQENLQMTQLTKGAKILRMDAFTYLQQGQTGQFDIIYVAPPQYQALWRKTLAQIQRQPHSYLTPKGMVIVQIDPKEFEPVDWQPLMLTDQRRYGNTLLCFYQLGGDKQEGNEK